jgi:hypothetical protein
MGWELVMVDDRGVWFSHEAKWSDVDEQIQAEWLKELEKLKPAMEKVLLAGGLEFYGKPVRELYTYHDPLTYGVLFPIRRVKDFDRLKGELEEILDGRVG